MRTVYLGNEAGVIDTLKRLSDLSTVVAEPIPAKAARHFGSSFQYARRRGIDVMSSEEFLRSPPPCDLLVSAGFGRYIPSRIIPRPSLGAINVHYSLLPTYRGRHPLNWAIINGEEQVGVTIHHVTDRLDAGPIILQEPVAVTDADDIMSVFAKCVMVGNRLLARVLAIVGTPLFRGRPQDESLASYYPPRRPQDGRIDWTSSARDIANLVRALTDPYPGAYFHYRDNRIIVDEAICTADEGAGPVGVPVACGENYRVRTGQGALLLTRLRGDSADQLPELVYQTVRG